MPGTPLPQLRAQAGSLTARDLARELAARGWSEQPSRRGKGSHRIFTKAGRRSIALPAHPARPTVLNILRSIAADEETDID